MIKFRSEMPTELLWCRTHMLILSLLLAVCHKGLKSLYVSGSGKANHSDNRGLLYHQGALSEKGETWTF